MDPNAPEEPQQPDVTPPPPPAEPSYEAYQELAPEPQPTYQEPPVQEPTQPPVPDPGAGVYDEPVVQETPPPPPEISAEPPAQSHRRRPAMKKRGRGPRPTTKRGGKPASRPGYQAASKRRPPVVHGEGISLFSVFLALIAVAMLVVVGMIIAPKDLSFIKGYSSGEDLMKTNPRNLLSEGQKIMLDRSGEDLVITEEEVNAYLNHRLQGSQGGAMASLIKYKGCYVDFTPGNAEFFIERSIFGFPLTMSTRIHLQRNREKTSWELVGGSVGKISLGPYQPQPVVEVFKRIRKTFEDEHQVLNQMVNIRFEKDKIVLDASY